MPLWYMVLTFQIPSMDADLVFRRFVGIVASRLLSLQCVIHLVVEETIFTESKFIFLFVNVSVTVDFVTALNPQHGGPEILLSKYLSSR